MKNIIIFGAGDLGIETHKLLLRINEVEPTWNVLGFCDDTKEVGDLVNGLFVLGNLQYLLHFKDNTDVIVAISNEDIKNEVEQKLRMNRWLKFPNVVNSFE